MIGTLDSQVIEKFKEFQEKTGKYLDLTIENVRFESITLSNDTYFEFIKGKNKYIQKYITKNPGEYPILGSSLKNECIANYIQPIDSSDVINKPCVSFNKDNAKGSIPFYRNYPFLMDRHHIAILCSDDIFPQYLYYSLITYFEKSKFGWGENVASVEEVSKHSVPVPIDLNEQYNSINLQRAIVEFLEYGFDNIERIKSNIDKRYEIVSKMKKSLIPSTFKRTAIKNKFRKYAQENSIDFGITDIKFETKKLNTIANFPSLKRVSGGFDLEIEEYAKLEEYNKDNYYPLITGTVTNNQISGYVHKDNLEDGSLSNKNVISWTRINADNFFLQDKPVCTNDDSFVLEQHENYVREFIRYSILETMRMKNFDWGNKAGQRKIKNIDILIPQPMQNYSSFEIQKILTSFINNINNEIEKYFNKYDRAHNIAKKLRETYLARTFSLINWSE